MTFQGRIAACGTGLRCLGAFQHRSRIIFFGSRAPLRPQHHRVRAHTARPAPARAALWSLPDDLASALHLGTSVAIILGLGLSALPILTGDAKERNEERFLRPNADEGADNVRWGVMSVLSFFPFLNPMAWVFAALDDETSSALYWTFAWIYVMPYVANGFELDGFAFAALALGVVHVQVERIACTEPAEVELPEVLRAILKALPQGLTALGRYGASVGGEVSGRVRRGSQAQARKPDRKYLEEKSAEARMELDEFDRRRRQREAEQRRRQEDRDRTR